MEKYSIGDLQHYANVFSRQDCKKIADCVSGPNWYFGHGSFVQGDARRGYPFWRTDLHENEYFSE